MQQYGRDNAIFWLGMYSNLILYDRSNATSIRMLMLPDAPHCNIVTHIAYHYCLPPVDTSHGYQPPKIDEYNNLGDGGLTLLLLQSNSPHVTGLCLDPDDYDVEGFTGTIVGNAIGISTHLKSVEICANSEPYEGFEDLCAGMARNRSIEEIIFEEFDFSFSSRIMTRGSLEDYNIFSILSSFFQYNSNLRCIMINNSHIGSTSLSLLKSALSKCSSLEKVKLDRNKNIITDEETGITDEEIGQLIEGLSGSKQLLEISLCRNEMRKFGSIALAKLMNTPQCKIQALNLSCSDIDDECINILANAMVRSKSIRMLNFNGCPRITSSGWRSLFTTISHHSIPLQTLLLNSIDDDGVIALGNALIVDNTLKHLDLGYSKSITQVGWKAFSKCLQSPNSMLEKLIIRDCGINDEGALAISAALPGSTLKELDMMHNRSITSSGWVNCFNTWQLNSHLFLERLQLYRNNVNDEGIAALVNALTHNNTLKSLIIGNESISSNGWRALSTILAQPSCSLIFLSCCSNNVNDEVLIDFANALYHNATLESFRFDGARAERTGPQITTRGWNALSHTLCNKSSIANTFSSNHTLQSICGGEECPGEVDFYLRMNQYDNKTEVARQKILMCHFVHEEDGNIHVFDSMDMNVLPHAIEWVGRGQDGSSLMYELVRGIPSLFESDIKVAAGSKRKYVPA